MTKNPQKDAIGVLIEYTVKENGVAVNLSSVTTKKFFFGRPDGTVFDRDAVFSTDGSNGKIKYVTVSGDLNQDGDWYAQPYLVFPGGYDGRAERVRFSVDKNV